MGLKRAHRTILKAPHRSGPFLQARIALAWPRRRAARPAALQLNRRPRSRPRVASLPSGAARFKGGRRSIGVQLGAAVQPPSRAWPCSPDDSERAPARAAARTSAPPPPLPAHGRAEPRRCAIFAHFRSFLSSPCRQGSMRAGGAVHGGGVHAHSSLPPILVRRPALALWQQNPSVEVQGFLGFLGASGSGRALAPAVLRHAGGSRRLHAHRDRAAWALRS